MTDVRFGACGPPHSTGELRTEASILSAVPNEHNSPTDVNPMTELYVWIPVV